MTGVDITVWQIALIAAGSALVGGLIAALFGVRNRRAARRVHRDMRQSITTAQAELDDAVAALQREQTRANEFRLDRDTASAEAMRLRAQLEELTRQLDRERDRAAVAGRQLADFQARFTDIVGLEAEIATLRVIAERVPTLERRLAELEGTPNPSRALRPPSDATPGFDPPTIDLRDSANNQE